MAAAAGESAESRRAAIVERISTIGQGIQRNLATLRAGDSAKLAGKRAETTDAHQPADGGKDLAASSELGREAGQPLVVVPHDQLGTRGGEGPPYDYSYMVDVAVYYARDNAVPYVLDTNDCTTFISWVLWNGRYAESGSEALIDAVFDYDDYDVWYYRCNDCSPRKTYTWGRARNWNIYENNYGHRVTFLPYLSDLLISDVFQMDFDGYGDPPNIPDHTTMVTGRGTDGWPLLSYHSNDSRNKPMWDTIGSEDGPYWAIRLFLEDHHRPVHQLPPRRRQLDDRGTPVVRIRTPLTQTRRLQAVDHLALPPTFRRIIFHGWLMARHRGRRPGRDGLNTAPLIGVANHVVWCVRHQINRSPPSPGTGIQRPRGWR